MSLKQRNPLIAATMLLAALIALMAQAQTASPAVPEDAAQWNTLWDYWKVGGFAMYPIGLCSVATVALAVYCWMQFKTARMMQPTVQPLLRDALDNGDVAQAITICGSAPGMLTNILAAGLARIGEDHYDAEKIDKAMEEASIEEVNEGMKPLTYLSVISQIAPMFGLLGTVTGMIGAFNKIGMGGMGDPEKLASDIGEAMITTAAGLLVAIPAMFAYFGFKTLLTSNIARISRLIGDLTHRLDTVARQAAAPAPGEAPR